ncbi:Nif3-like dinuclear metal center hexameric protein [Thermotalea metallivorans]|uniref:GTP cyclohydrolase 1 type 2 homolog n=1 Tax=Thermotalea metallivorans TaxID=520762 RepID=A0A140L5S1_9FIRM|nr:Nif3-like dinuclear metal center hexameric protein [Thermotalea metallivorans]KXG75896.1 putative GTP cyclohydrolase 1 type 2 [Thermotalea metallivorans]
MPEKCQKIINFIENFAPSPLAERWDNVGLQIGDRDKAIHRVMVCLEVTDAVIDEAVSKNIDMIITHHPLIFKPVKSIRWDDPIGRMIQRLIRQDIVLYCVHTNLDVADGGTNDAIALALNMEEIKPLTNTYKEKFFKLAVFVPESHVEAVREAMCSAGAGHIGNYSHCTFQTLGIGTFQPLEGSNPFIGTRNTLERISEYKLETIVSHKMLHPTIEKMLKAHPYEEVAYDVFALENEVDARGMGRIGVLREPVKLSIFCEKIKSKLELQTIRIAGDANRFVRKIALCTGSGSEFIYDAYQAGCDCYITGDVKYHDAQYALQLGIAVIDAGHFETENFACKMIAQYLGEMARQQKYDIEIMESTAYINPFHVL